MILQQATIKYKGYDPDSLSNGSNKRVCCSCDDCGRVRYVSYQAYRNLCLKCSSKTGKNHHRYKSKIILICQYCKNEFKVIPALQNKKFCSKKCYGKWQSINRIGENNPNYGISPKQGKNSPRWRGGRTMTAKRSYAKRRDFKYIPLNKPFPGCEGHHITKSLVIHIPKELHKHLYHNLKTGLNMESINLLALQFINGGL